MKQVSLNQVILKNPLVMAPMTTQLSFFNGIVTEDEINYYANRSKDVGMVITGASNVQKKGKGWFGELGVYSDAHIEGLSRLASAIKGEGAKAVLQLFHAGRMTSSAVLNGEQPVSASQVKAMRANAEEPRALTNEEIYQVIEDFKHATYRAIQAGFDGIELHGANTYLIQQFYSPHSNRREDQWGGTLDKRFMFIEKLTDAIGKVIKEHASEGFIFGYRFSPEEYEIPGIRMEDTRILIERLSVKPIDYLHLSVNDYQRQSIQKEYQGQSLIEWVHTLTKGKIPLMGVGGVTTKEDVAQVLSHCELVAVGHALLIDPRWGKKIIEGRENDIRTRKDLGNDKELEMTDVPELWEFVQRLRPDK